MLTVYTYSNCDTCRKAVKWMRAQDLKFTEKPIRETPPSAEELRRMLAHVNGDIRRLFNTSGKDYRELGLKDQLPQLSDAAAIALLSRNGNLVKRPFLLGPECGLVGFAEQTWHEALT